MLARRVFTILGLTLGLLVATLVLWPRAGHPLAVQPEPTATPAAETKGIDGAALYDRLCDKCHGLTEKTYGPQLSTRLTSITDEALQLLILKGKPDSEMPAVSESLTPGQLAALIKFVKTNALGKTPAELARLEVAPDAPPTQMTLALVEVQGSDLIVRGTLKDAQGKALVKKKVNFSKIAELGGRMPLATVDTNEQGAAIYYYPLKAGESLRVEAEFYGERDRQPSMAAEQITRAGGAELEPLATGLSAATPPLGLLALIGLVIGTIWLIYAYVVSLVLRVASDETPVRVRRR